MKLEDVTTVDQLTDFLSGTQAVAFLVVDDKDAHYRWLLGELIKLRYGIRHSPGGGQGRGGQVPDEGK